MSMDTIRRLAADILKVGELKVKINPDGVKEAEKAMTRSDVRDLIKKGIITRAPIMGRRKKERRRRRSIGSRKGTSKARTGGKAVWMDKVRAQRAFLKQLLAEEAFDKKHKRILYMRIKSGLFRNKRAFLAYLKENGLTKQEYEPKKKEWVPKVKPQKTGKPKALAQKPIASTAPAKAAAPKPTAVGMSPRPAVPTTSKEANKQ